MLRLTGVPGVVGQEQHLPHLSDKTYCLVAMVVLRFHGRAPRGDLAWLLWEENDTPAALGNLRNVLARLKAWQRQTGLALLEWDADRVWRTAACQNTDVELLLEAATPTTPQELSSIDHCYAGRLIAARAEFAPDLSAWLQDQASALREHVTRLLVAAPPALPGLQKMLRRFAAEMPLDERIGRALMIAASLDSADAVDFEYNI